MSVWRGDAPAGWDAFVRGVVGGSVFHSEAWGGAIASAFGHKTVYVTALRAGEIVAGVPLCVVRSLLGGTMVVSMPYGVYGGVLGEDEAAVELVYREARAFAQSVDARVLDFRSEIARFGDAMTSDRYVTFRRALPDDPAACLGMLPRKARAAARAAREKYRLDVSDDDGHLPDVWRLYCRNMSRLASLSYPFRFFEELIARTPGEHLVSLVSFEGRPVAGLVTFLFEGTAMPYFVGADERFKHVSAYNLIYLAAMERAVKLGYRSFDFGRSRRDNSGSCAFKRNQGFEATALAYQTVTFAGRRAANLSPSNPRFALARRVWPRLPMALTCPLSGWLSRHIPG